MNRTFRMIAVTAALAASSSLGAQATPAMPKGATANTASVVVSVLRDANGVASKFVALANSIPAEKYDWRPAPGVRSIREVFLHVASDNYLLPALAGALATAAPAATGIDSKDFTSLERYEKRPLSKDSVVAELERSFTHLASAMGRTRAADLTAEISMFGQKSAVQDLWIITATHLHEHLGQQIAYVRLNGIVPPWSK